MKDELYKHMPQLKRITIVVDAKPLGNSKLDTNGCEKIAFSVDKDKPLKEALANLVESLNAEPVERKDVF